MYTLIIVVFVLGYIGIALEHITNINKTAVAIVTGILCWTIFMFYTPDGAFKQTTHYQNFVEILKIEKGPAVADLTPDALHHEFVTFSLSEHLGNIAQILFFLLGAMTIVELVDAHHGFRVITDRIRTKDPIKLLWMICWITFFLSAILDNLTTTIVMVSLIRKLISDKEEKYFFASMVVVAANAGGAWTPIGDVTTTMLWIGGKITTVNIMKMVLLPSLVCMIVPLIFLSFTMKRKASTESEPVKVTDHAGGSGRLMLILGVGALISVPIFKTLTHMPPYAGILLGLGLLWIISELINPEKDEVIRKQYTVAGALSRIDVPSVLFFLGILLAVGALESMQALHALAHSLDATFGDQRIIVTLIGILSAVVDNVPLVAASMGMYDATLYPTDHLIWEYLAYCAGTGGSILIIGSAAGVAVMGMERVNFIWYVKKISLLALLGYLAGAGAYIVQKSLL